MAHRPVSLVALLLCGCYDFSPFDSLDAGVSVDAAADRASALDLASTDSPTPLDLPPASDLTPSFSAAPAQFPVNANATSVEAADFNGDGKLDLAVTDFGGGFTISILLGNGDGTFQTAINIGAPNRAAFFVRAADFNGDKKLDLAVVSGTPDNIIEIFFGNGNGTFGAPSSYMLGAGNYLALAVGDLNGDGQPDLVTADASGTTVTVLFGLINGTFKPAVSSTVGAAPHAVVVADLNGDGKLDLATANFNDANVGVLLNSGAGAFLPVASYGTGGQQFPSSIAAGDLNGDGKLDLVVNTNTPSGWVSVLLNIGGGTFATGKTYATGGAYPEMLVLTDLNGDGRLDVANTNFGVCCVMAPGSLTTLLGQGDGTLLPATVLAPTNPGDNIHALRAADVNGDGRPDLVITTKSFHDVFVYLNQ